MKSIAILLLMATPVMAAQKSAAELQPVPHVYAPNGKFLGNVTPDRYDPNSINNSYGRFGSPYENDSVQNPYGRYSQPHIDADPTDDEGYE